MTEALFGCAHRTPHAGSSRLNAFFNRALLFPTPDPPGPKAPLMPAEPFALRQELVPEASQSKISGIARESRTLERIPVALKHLPGGIAGFAPAKRRLLRYCERDVDASDKRGYDVEERLDHI
jgi:hypothetical protein